MRIARKSDTARELEPVRVLGRGLRAQRGVRLTLRVLREAAGKTQTDVAATAHVHAATQAIETTWAAQRGMVRFRALRKLTRSGRRSFPSKPMRATGSSREPLASGISSPKGRYSYCPLGVPESSVSRTVELTRSECRKDPVCSSSSENCMALVRVRRDG